MLIQPEVNLIYIIYPERAGKQGTREVLFPIVTQGTRLINGGSTDLVAVSSGTLTFEVSLAQEEKDGMEHQFLTS